MSRFSDAAEHATRRAAVLTQIIVFMCVPATIGALVAGGGLLDGVAAGSATGAALFFILEIGRATGRVQFSIDSRIEREDEE